ncbi:hypothetical protein J6590_053521 [Homalodisca vitripennis]|nr:hypothetical protein J6590_053521 [Homalodisca vitripennis]
MAASHLAGGRIVPLQWQSGEESAAYTLSHVPVVQHAHRHLFCVVPAWRHNYFTILATQFDSTATLSDNVMCDGKHNVAETVVNIDTASSRWRDNKLQLGRYFTSRHYMRGSRVNIDSEYWPARDYVSITLIDIVSRRHNSTAPPL